MGCLCFKTLPLLTKLKTNAGIFRRFLAHVEIRLVELLMASKEWLCLPIKERQ